MDGKRHGFRSRNPGTNVQPPPPLYTDPRKVLSLSLYLLDYFDFFRTDTWEKATDQGYRIERFSRREIYRVFFSKHRIIVVRHDRTETEIRIRHRRCLSSDEFLSELVFLLSLFPAGVSTAEGISRRVLWERDNRGTPLAGFP